MSSLTMNVDQPSGKFLRIIHRINDALWLMGSKKMPERIIIKQENEVNNQNGCEINGTSEITQNLGENVGGTLENITNNQTSNNVLESIKENFQINIDTNKQISSNGGDNETEDKTININNIEINESEPILTLEENDTNLEILFLHLVKLHFKNNQDIFPLDPGKLLKDYLKPLSKELNLPFDIKTSSYKKINNFLKFLQKEKNLISFGKPKGLQNDFLLGVVWEHQMIKDFLPKVKKLLFIDRLNDESEDEKENLILQKDEKIEVSQLFKPNMKIKKFFEKTDKNFDNSSYYPLKHCNEILTSYLKEKDLFLKGGNAKIDQELKEALFAYDKDISLATLECCKLDDLLLKWKKNLNEKNFITKTGANQEQTILTNTNLKVKIYAKKVANKNVTIVDGLQNFAKVKDLIKIFSKHFACAVTLKDFQSVKDAIFIQGYWISELVELLQAELKLNKQFIQVEDKLNLKTKKK